MIRNNVTIKTIASELGISPSTVSRALKNNPRIGLKTREEVNKMAELLHFTPNPAALNLQKRQTNTLGLIVPTLMEEFFSHVVSGIEEVASKQGFHIIVNQSNNCMQTEKDIIQSYIRSKVDGMMVSISAETNDYSHFVKVQKHGIPIVFYDRVPRNFPSNKIKSEVVSGAIQAINFLYKQNKRKIALLNGPPNLEASDERLNGYLEAIKKLNLTTKPDYIKSTNLTKEDTYEKMTEFIGMKNNRPDAIICFNDYVSLHAIKACRKQEIIPNQDITFASFANIGITEFLEIRPAASVEQFPVEMGIQSARLLLENIQSPEGHPYREVKIRTELIVHPD